MKREILFRGKCIRTNKWVYGFLCAKDVINTDKGRLKVIPETIGQFTGLTDQKGVKIFEGDIMETPSKHIVEIRFCNVKEVYKNEYFEYLGFSAFNLKQQKAYHLDDSITKGEVIGNIHE